jgi:hypothetical protein
MTTTFNGWVVTQRIKKETMRGTSYKLRLEDMSATHKLTLTVDENQYLEHQIKDKLPAGLLKQFSLGLSEKDRKQTLTGTKVKLTYVDDDEGAKLKLDAGAAEYSGSTVGDPLDAIKPLYQSKMPDATPEAK